jgi:predicted RNA methylase
MRVSDEVMTVLDQVQTDGHKAIITGQLDRKLYEAVNKVLECCGGKWNRSAKAHLFDCPADEALAQVLATGEAIDAKRELNQFYTPLALVDRVMAAAGIEPGMRVLEPSAGPGRLASAALLAGAVVDCVELDPKNVQLLCSTAYNAVHEGDFLAWADTVTTTQYDRIIMNPPFAKQADIDHVFRASMLLAPGGRLVAIMSAGVMFRQNRLTVDFRDFVGSVGGSIVPLPDDAFKESGTLVRTVLVTIY